MQPLCHLETLPVIKTRFRQSDAQPVGNEQAHCSVPICNRRRRIHKKDPKVTWSGPETPKPTQTGLSVASRSEEIRPSTRDSVFALAPVTPAMEFNSRMNHASW